jgi:hypothetical protein
MEQLPLAYRKNPAAHFGRAGRVRAGNRYYFRQTGAGQNQQHRCQGKETSLHETFLKRAVSMGWLRTAFLNTSFVKESSLS